MPLRRRWGCARWWTGRPTQVVGEDGSTQRVEAGTGVPLRYTLTLVDGGWRLTEVGSRDGS